MGIECAAPAPSAPEAPGCTRRVSSSPPRASCAPDRRGAAGQPHPIPAPNSSILLSSKVHWKLSASLRQRRAAAGGNSRSRRGPDLHHQEIGEEEYLHNLPPSSTSTSTAYSLSSSSSGNRVRRSTGVGLHLEGQLEPATGLSCTLEAGEQDDLLRCQPPPPHPIEDARDESPPPPAFWKRICG